MVFRTGTSFPNRPLVADGYDTFNTLQDGVDIITAENPNSLADSIQKVQKSLVDGYAVTDLLAQALAFEDQQTIVYSAALDKMVVGSSGDSSLKLQNCTAAGVITVKGGTLLLSDGREVATYDGAGTATSDFGVDLTTTDLDSVSLLSGTITDNTTYYLYADLNALTATTITSGAWTGRVVYGLQASASHYVLSTSAPSGLNLARYLPLGFVRKGTGAGVWSTTNFSALAFRRHDKPAGTFSPVVYTNATITSANVGTITHSANVNPEDQFWTAQLNGADGYVSQLSDDWLVDIFSANVVEVDFSFLAVGDTVTLKLENRGLTNLGANPVKTYSITAPANTISLPLSHGLSGVPTSLSLMQEIAAGEFEPLDFGSFLSVTGTQIKGSLAALTTTVVKIVSSVGAEAVVSSFYRSKIVAASTSASAGDELFVDTTAARTITLPASPSLGERVKIVDFTGGAGTNNITVARNGSNIEGAASDFIINADRGGVEMIYTNSAQGWIVLGL